MDNLFNYHSPFGDALLKLRVGSYAQNQLSLAISMIAAEDGLPYSTATVNLGPYTGNDSLIGKYCAFLDPNNMPGIEDFLIENGLAEPYTRFGSPVYEFCGFCSYPLYSFNPEVLKELDPEGCAAYEEGYKEALEEELKKLNQATYGLDYNWFEEHEFEQIDIDNETAISDIVDDVFNLVERYYANGYRESYWTPVMMSEHNLSLFGILLTPEKAEIEMSFFNKETEHFVLTDKTGKLQVSSPELPSEELSIKETKKHIASALLSAVETPSLEMCSEAMFKIEDLLEQMAEQEAGGIEEIWELE